MRDTKALTPHRFEGAAESCIWCGATHEAAQDNLVSAECPASDPVERVLIEAAEKLAAEIALRGREADMYLARLNDCQADQKVLIDQLAAINAHRTISCPASKRRREVAVEIRRDALDS